MPRYYVWVNRGTETRPVPLVSEGYQGPYTLDTAKQYARIAAGYGRYGRIVSSNTDPKRLKVVRAYPAGGKAKPNHRQHAEWLAEYLNQDVDPGDYLHLVEDLFGEDADVYGLDSKQLEKLLEKVQHNERRLGIDDCETPAYRVFMDARVAPPGGWYVHFSSASFSHFAYGASLMTGLAFTDCGGTDKTRSVPGDNASLDTSLFEVMWGFAFPADRSTMELRDGARKYGGRHARFLLFRSDEAVLAYHRGDDEMQAMFVIGSEYDVITGHFSGSSAWVVETEDGELDFSSMREIVAWANEHYPLKATPNGYQPNRLVQLSREEEIEIAENILASVTDSIGRLVEEGTLHFDQNLGDLVGEEGYYVEIYSHHRVKVIVQNPCTEKPAGMGYALSKFFTSGDYAPALNRLRVYANSCRTVADWLEPTLYRSRLRDFLDVWLHEETHSSDRGLRRGGVGYHGGAQSVGSAEGQMPVREYVNLPAEVKAFGRNVYEEAARSAEFIVSGAPGMAPSSLRKFQSITRQKRGERPLEYLIRGTPTWKNIVGSGLSEDNQRRILRDVYLQLEEDGWAAAVEQTLSDPTLTQNRRQLRRNAPLTGFDLFDMEDEPEVSATPRSAYEQAVGSPASRQPAHTLLRSSKLPAWLSSAAAEGLYVATTPTGQGSAYLLSWFVDLPPGAKANNTTARALRSALIPRRDLPASEYALHKAPLYLFDHETGQLVRFEAT